MFRVVVFRLGVARPRDGDRLQEVTSTLDPKKLTKGEQILGVSGLVLFLVSFLPLWAKYELEIAGNQDSQRFSLWDAYGFHAKLAVILALIAVIFVVIRALGTNLSLPVPTWQIYLGLAGITLLLILLALITGPAGDQGTVGGPGFSQEWSRGLIGLLLGLASAAAMAYGAYLHMNEEGASPTTTHTGPGPTTPPPPAS